ncbi:efflux RND transporter permease subunit [Methylobacter tundripaludum]|uniref:Acriflavin resistance protein n=1 Tax=Methylobacter tundripaludum (strain ATCC BAA-1195 / DSM 17260 / SV96) TaxID=697282 RepID=G3IXP1_METTV|nr:efflux RND transporter permease subunit [Methylobacter tundripaludum]EGW23450.1 acriflavin resistance protein [Methylobacter tundripaludum SV96]
MNSPSQYQSTGLLAWFASNPVAANLLMILIIIGGIVGFRVMDKEVFPRFSPRQIDIMAAYPGAGPLEIEESVCVRIEEAIVDMPGVKRLDSAIREGECTVSVSILPDYDQEQIINSLRGRIQNIPRLPKNLEKIDIQPATRNGDDGVIWVALHGPTDPLTLQRFGERFRADLEQIPGVLRVRNYGEIPYEIVIEVAAAKLNQYHLSLHDVTEAVRRASLDQSGGLVKTPSGELQLRVKGKAQDAASIGNLVLRTHADGTRLRLGEVAVIRDGLEERLSEWHHNGETAQGWEIHTQYSSVEVARRVKDYVADMQPQLPEGLLMTTWWDDSQAYDERVRTLVEDGLGGFVLVCLVLTLFLRLRVAIWAGVGIFTSVLGALWLMPALDVSLNMLSLFGFLLAMGILVDDAIIIGESVYSHQQDGQDAEASLAGAIRGVQAVALPVILSVLVALVAFLPGLFLPGWAGQMMKPICLVMILTLVFSLIEALLILPSHLAAPNRAGTASSGLERLREKLNRGLERFVDRYYRPFLQRALDWRYLTVTGFIVLLLLCGAWLDSGRLRMSLQADVTKDSFWVSLASPQDMPYSEVRNRAQQVEQAFFALRDELDGVGNANHELKKASIVVGLETMIFEHGAGFWTEFSAEGRQRIVVEDFINEWRKRVGDLGRTKIDFLYKEGDVPYDIEFDLGTADPELLPKAAETLKNTLAAYPGVYDVVDSSEPGKPEIRLTLKPEAERLGLRLEDLSAQVRHGYYGDEVQRLQRGRNEVKVMVRYPRRERQSLDSLAALPVQLPDGQHAPLGTLAKVTLTPGVAKLIRQDRRRVLKVQARVDPQKADVNAIYAGLESGALKNLRLNYPGLSVSIGQERQEQQAITGALGQYTLISLLVIYVLIAVPFRSYLKPLIFLLAAPVAWCGAVIAHGLAGLPLSMESLVGMIAASGVVVNDSLVLLDYMKEHHDPQKPITELICEACTSRFRPIFLAFLTNFAGFLPALLETSPQAQFLIPMTLSLSAGLLLGMTASLILTPVCYAILGKQKDAGLS